MKRPKKGSIRISGKTLRVHIPGSEETFNLIGNVGDAIVAYPIPQLLQEDKFTTPSGEEIRIPYVIGKIDDIRTCEGSLGKLNLEYDFVAYIDMENGEHFKITGRAHHRNEWHDFWRICPLDKYFVPKISDYRAYTKYYHEREAAHEAFWAEWVAKDPMKLSREV